MRVLLIANALRNGAGYEDAVARLDAMAADLTKAVPPGVAVLERADPPPVTSNLPPGAFEDGVERIREHIRELELLQRSRF